MPNPIHSATCFGTAIFSNRHHQTKSMAQKTKLLFFVVRAHHGNDWIVRCENIFYGPFLTFHDAFAGAVEEAQAAGLTGFESSVLALGEHKLFNVHWAYGKDPYPPPTCGHA